MISSVFALIGTALALAAGAPGTSAEEDARPPNIVYVLADDLGWGELGCYGQEKIRTPNVDRIAREGMRFTRHYSGSPVCAPSRCVLLTGKHTGHAVVRNNWESGGWGEDAPEGQYPFPEETLTVAEVLKARGYATGCFGKWGNGGPETSGHPNAQGFDTFVGYLCQRKAHNYYPKHLWKNGEKLVLPGNGWYSAHQKIAEPLESEEAYYERYNRETYAPAVMLDAALEFMAENRDKPFFLYYPSPIPHVALQAPRSAVEAYRGEFEETPYLGQKAYLPHPTPRAAYAAMVTHLDAEVGAILDRLDAYGLRENTIVMFSSDNGPTFNGGSDSTFFNSAPGMRGLKVSVYEGGIRVPFVVRWPGRVAAGTSSDHLSAFQDVMPTLAELVGAPAIEGLDGLSLVPTLLGEGEQQQHELLYWELGGQQAIRWGKWKGVRRGLKKGNTHLELYDLEAYPLESADVSAENPEVVQRLLELLAREHVPSEVFPLPTIDD